MSKFESKLHVISNVLQSILEENGIKMVRLEDNMVSPVLVKRFSVKQVKRLMREEWRYFFARYCPAESISAVPEEDIKYGDEIAVVAIHDGVPLMLTIHAVDKEQRYDVPITDIAYSKYHTYK